MDNKPTPRKLLRQIGVSGTQIYSGIITAEEYNARLTGLQGIRQYEIMRRSDPIVRQTMQVVKLPILRAEWYLEPASEEDEDVFRCGHLKRELFERNVSWPRFQREALTQLDFGHSVIEKTLELTEYEGRTLIGIAELGYRKQTTIFNWETQDEKEGITQLTPKEGRLSIPREKLMYFVFDQEGDNWQGVSLLRYAFKPWDIKNRAEKLNAIGIEKTAVGVPVAEVPADASPDEIARLDEAMKEFRGNESGYIRKPAGWNIEMLDLKTSSNKDVLPTIQYYDRQVQSSVLAQFLSLGADSSSGSRATSEDHSKLFLMSEEALAEQFASVVQKELIEPLCDLNFSDMKNGYPKLKFGKIGDDDIRELGDFVHKLYSAGAMKYDPEVENHLRRTGRLPEIPEKELEELKEQEKERRENETIQESQQQNKKPGDKDQEDIQAAVTLREAKKIRERLIGSLPGA